MIRPVVSFMLSVASHQSESGRLVEDYCGPAGSGRAREPET